MPIETVGIKVDLQKRREASAGLRDVRTNLDEVADAGHDVANASDDAARGLEKASSHRFARGFSAIGRGIRGVGGYLGRGFVSAARVGAAGVGILTAGLAAASVKAIALSSDARETGSAFQTVFGRDAKAVQGNINELTRRFGLYNPELQDAARQFGVFGKAAGVARKELPRFSTDLVRAGLDLSSFYNTDPGETFQALQSGLSGEAEPLRKFGIFISDAAMKAKAATMGLTGELTDQQKVMVRQALILQSLGDAQGDLERTSQGFANQQRAATGRVKTFFTLLGGPLTTAATGAFRGFNAIAKAGIRELRKALPGLERDGKHLSQRFQRWGRQLAHDLPDGIRKTSDAWGTFTGYVRDASGRVREFMAQGGRRELGQLGSNLKDLGPAAAAFARELPGISDTLSVVNIVTGFLAKHTDLLGKAVPYLIAGYIALKASQLAANVVLAASIPLKVAELVTNRQLTKSNQALVASRAGVVATTGAETVAVGANTAAQNTGILARGRAVAGMVAQKAAMVAGAAVTGVMTAAQWALNVAMTANPIGLIVVGLIALAAGLVVAWKKSDTFRKIVTGAFDAVKNAALWAFNWVKGHWPLLLAILTGPIGIAVLVITKNWDRIKAGAGAVKDFIVNKFTALIGFYKSMPTRIGRAVRGMFDGIKTAFRGAINFIIDGWNGLSFSLPGFDPPGPGPKFGGISIGTPNIPRLAGGGDVQPYHPYIVGDGGRSELFIPDRPGYVHKSVDDGLDALDGARGHETIQIVLDGKVVAQTVRKHWRNKGRRR